MKSAKVTDTIARRINFQFHDDLRKQKIVADNRDLFVTGAATEQLNRAFDTGFLTADRGVGAIGELAVQPFKGAKFGTSEFYVFADGAWIGILGRGVPGRTDYSLGSAGVGTRMRFRDKAELGLELAKPIDDPYPGYDEDWRVSVSYRLSL